MLLATSVAVDTDRANHRVLYPQIAQFSGLQRRLIYWRCACVFFATACRTWPDAERVLYTNDDASVSLGGRDLRSFLAAELGVEIVPLPFRRFKAAESLCRIFRNNFYKHEVLEDLTHRSSDFAILADSDCVWLRPPAPGLTGEPDALHLVEAFRAISTTHEFQGVSQARLGAVFRTIDPSYPQAYPRWFGGELIAGSRDLLLQLRDDLGRAFDLISRRPDYDRLTIGESRLLENDEWLLSFVVQRRPYAIRDARPWFDRVWTGPGGHPSADCLRLSGVHLLAEKQLGFRAIFDEVLDRRSEFWCIDLTAFPDYLGGFFGVPRRTCWPHYSAAERTVQLSAAALRRLGVRLPAQDRLSRLVRRLIPRL